MDSEDKKTLWQIGIVSAAILLIFWGVMIWDIILGHFYTSRGYEQRMLPGSEMGRWVKIDK